MKYIPLRYLFDIYRSYQHVFRGKEVEVVNFCKRNERYQIQRKSLGVQSIFCRRFSHIKFVFLSCKGSAYKIFFNPRID